MSVCKGLKQMFYVKQTWDCHLSSHHQNSIPTKIVFSSQALHCPWRGIAVLAPVASVCLDLSYACRWINRFVEDKAINSPSACIQTHLLCRSNLRPRSLLARRPRIIWYFNTVTRQKTCFILRTISRVISRNSKSY